MAGAAKLAQVKGKGAARGIDSPQGQKKGGVAAGDYRSCDVCGCKVFYDANLNYEQEDKWNIDRPFAKECGMDLPKFENYKLDYLGDWAVLCGDCAKTHKAQIVPIVDTTANADLQQRLDAAEEEIERLTQYSDMLDRAVSSQRGYTVRERDRADKAESTLTAANSRVERLREALSEVSGGLCLAHLALRKGDHADALIHVGQSETKADVALADDAKEGK